MKTIVTIAADRCCCSGNCELAFPDLFAVPDDGGPAVLLPPALSTDRQADVEMAAAGCPTGAINVRSTT